MKHKKHEKKNLLVISRYRSRALQFLQSRYLGCFILQDIYNIIHINREQDLAGHLYNDIRVIWMDGAVYIKNSDVIHNTIKYYKNIELGYPNQKL